MPNDNAIKFGILKCRDLVELYYGARMVTSIVETQTSGNTTPAQLLAPDPRRIKYEIVLSNADTANGHQAALGSPASFGTFNEQFYFLPPNGTIVVERDFLTDMDSVCSEVDFTTSSGSVTLCARETFLTPIPVDEMP